MVPFSLTYNYTQRGILPEKADLNGYTRGSQNGTWYSTSVSPINAPDDNCAWSYFLVFTTGEAGTLQMFYKSSTNTLYIRRYQGSPASWNTWKAV